MRKGQPAVSSIDFELLKKYTEIPQAAETLLAKPEREVYFNLNLKIHANHLLQADSYVVYFNTVRGVAKGGM